MTDKPRTINFFPVKKLRNKSKKKTSKKVNSVTNDGHQIYFLISGNHVKIGLSKNVKQRIVDLQTGNPIKLELLYSYPTKNNLPHLVESRLHHKFKKDRVHNEWFILSDDIKNYIKKLKSNK